MQDFVLCQLRFDQNPPELSFDRSGPFPRFRVWMINELARLGGRGQDVFEYVSRMKNMMLCQRLGEMMGLTHHGYL
jgi:hypothetical protein